MGGPMKQRFAILSVLMVACFSSQLFSAVPTEYEKAYQYFNERDEIYIAIYPSSFSYVRPLVDVVSIDRLDWDNYRVLAYATKDAFEKFLAYDMPYKVLTPPSLLIDPPMSDYKERLSGKPGVAKTAAASGDWYAYPTYSAYVGFLNMWATTYPTRAKLYDLGASGVAARNHRIYALRISSNVGAEVGKPKYLETNTIHGDEVLNMMNCLHMIDTLILSYGQTGQTRITRMLDSLDMWFIPNMNPDGTYRSGDNTVSGAQRANVANGFDLNRNNPCPCGAGTHVLYGLYTLRAMETQALMGLHALYKFPFAQDQHGGTETYLWPYGGIPTRPNDENWYRCIITRLVNQIHVDCGNNGYMTSCGGDGMGHIFSELYECHGIRCDMNDYYGNGKSITLESSITKLLPAAELQNHWKWCKEALMQSIEILILEGLHGFIKDSVTGLPVFGVRVTRNSDWTQNAVLTDSAGKYVKFMNDGTWTITFTHPNYVTRTVTGVVATCNQRRNLSLKMMPNVVPVDFKPVAVENPISIISYKKGISIRGGKLDDNAQIGIYNMTGKLIRLIPVSSSGAIWDGTNRSGNATSNGWYVVKIANKGELVLKSFILNR